jgi:hypothetical protein
MGKHLEYMVRSPFRSGDYCYSVIALQQLRGQPDYALCTCLVHAHSTTCRQYGSMAAVTYEIESLDLTALLCWADC